MELDKIRRLLDELAAFMKENDLAELEIDVDGADVKLRKTRAPAPEQVLHHAALPPAAPVAPAAAPAPAEDGGPEPGTAYVTSPMVGSFYRAPKPEADPFTDVGEPVDEGTVLCIIEAMKVMNEIKAEHSGRVLEILVENGEPVEYGQPLFLLALND